MVCRRECGWLFVSLCQPCDETVTCPMGDPWTHYTNWILGCGIAKPFVAMPKLRLLGLDLCPSVNVTVRVSVEFEVRMKVQGWSRICSGRGYN